MVTIAMHYDTEPVGIPLVLLPPFPLDARVWRPVRSLLADLPVIAVDPPGFGDSADPTALAHRLGRSAVPALETYAAGVADALDQLGIDRIVLAGVSIGGYTAMAFAAMYPERLAGIGLLNTIAAADTPERRELRERMAVRVEEGASPSALMAGLLYDVVSPMTRTEREQLYERLENWYEQAPATGIAWSQRAMSARPGRLDVLAGLKIPALVLRGQDDAIAGVSASQDMAQALGTAVVEIPRAGHMAVIEEPEPVAAALRDLWERSTRG